MSEDVWSERDTNPDAVDAALRDLLRKRHAANPALAPARVLNLIVVIDRAQSGALLDQLGHLGRHSSSRTILCAVEDRRRTLDVTAVMSYEEPPTGGFGLIHERVEIHIGPKHLRRLKTIVDPVLIPELPTTLWCPQHERAIDTLRGLVDTVVLDSDRTPEPAAALARAAELARSTYVVDMAWIRTTPWRERLAAGFDPPARLAALQSLTTVWIRHRTGFSASGMLLAGWLASRLQWKTSPFVPDNRGGLQVAQGAGALVVPGPAADAAVLGGGDLDAVDEVAVPDRLEQRVGKAHCDQVLNRLLSEVVVDPEYLGLVEHAQHLPV
jgi:glucose-6-phosphate dehydrogenase assembly protein OpcA